MMNGLFEQALLICLVLGTLIQQKFCDSIIGLEIFRKFSREQEAIAESAAVKVAGRAHNQKKANQPTAL